MYRRSTTLNFYLWRPGTENDICLIAVRTWALTFLSLFSDIINSAAKIKEEQFPLFEGV